MLITSMKNREEPRDSARTSSIASENDDLAGRSKDTANTYREYEHPFALRQYVTKYLVDHNELRRRSDNVFTDRVGRWFCVL